MNIERVLILEKGSFCHYDPMLDLIVISQCYREDPEFFEYVLEHEREHRRIHLKHGYLGVFHHVILDWKNRFTFMTSNYPRFRKFMKLGNDDGEMFKNTMMSIVYGILTFPTQFFAIGGMIRMIFDGILGGIRWLINMVSGNNP